MFIKRKKNPIKLYLKIANKQRITEHEIQDEIVSGLFNKECRKYKAESNQYQFM